MLPSSNSPLPCIKASDYTYNLPNELIAQHPLEPRDASRILTYRGGKITHDLLFSNLGNLLSPSSTFLINNTRVLPARLHFNKSTGARIEIFLLEMMLQNNANLEYFDTRKSTLVWKCLVGNAKKWKDNEILQLNQGESYLEARWYDRTQMQVELTWQEGVSFESIIQLFGQMPLPPYMSREVSESDKSRYQTEFSSVLGAVAAPTAGLHFSKELLEALKNQGHSFQELTLHVSAGTFLPMKVDNALEHPMHQERISINKTTLLHLLKGDSSVIAVGTTSVRTIESVVWYGYVLLQNLNAPFFVSKLQPYEVNSSATKYDALRAVLDKMDREGLEELLGNTEIMIVPGYTFQMIDGLITNFHQPNSTLLLLVAAFIGEHWKAVYQEAIAEKYRFLSYGDACFFEREG